MKLGSLFDGSGGFPLAGAIHGITPVWASEIEPYPIRVTKARFPQMKHLGSVLDVNGAEVEPVDIITFGSPCQDLSVAGKQAGLHKGERSNLFFEAIRIIKEMREATDGIYPRIAVWENVPGAYSSNKGEDFRAVLQAFCSVKDETADVPRPAAGKWNPAGAIVGYGWSVAWRTFDAQFWGVPQRRKRIYLIADFGSERAGEILFEQEGVRRDIAESGKAGQGAAGDAQGSAGRGCAYGLTTKGNGEAFISEELHAALSCGGGQAGQGYPAIIYSATQQSGTAREGTADNAEGGVDGSVGAIVFKERAGCPGGGKGILCGDKPFTLSTMTDQAVCYPIDLIRESRGAFEAYSAGNGQLHQALEYEMARPLDCMHDQQIVLHPSKPPRKYIIRRLTPLECARLQGFPDWWEDGVQGSDSARYKMWGNGLALPNAAHVGLARQVCFFLPGGVRYYADFVTLHADGSYRVIDAKSAATRKNPVYRLKKRQMKACLGLDIEEV